jgi:hypothetical protein
MAVGVTARLSFPFQSWDKLIAESVYIAVVQCGDPTPPVPNHGVINATRSDVRIQITARLKGTNNVSPVRLLTDHEMISGRDYLVFGYCDCGVFTAYEEYRVVPLDEYFATNLIAGKLLNEQIQIIVQRRLYYLKLEMPKNEEEERRLEDGLKKQ